ncbi:BA75_04368T0 [Komagataella pastoris]|uniref:DNA replication licensing factor MCM7 n=1 Tax=Komagataella pastoris TaxID=4922 RepID=A0A1B2JI54_PICPA|nr:BA75_04368T0 [Komagataella pastoris]
MTSAILPSIQLSINYKEIKSKVKDFLLHFKENSRQNDGNNAIELSRPISMDDNKNTVGPKYMNLLQAIANRELGTLYIDLDDVQFFEQTQGFADDTSSMGEETLCERIVKNTYHFVELFSQVVDEILPSPSVDINYKDDVLDVILHQRKLRNLRIQEEEQQENFTLYDSTLPHPEFNRRSQNSNEEINTFPAKLIRRYCVYFRPLSNTKGKKTLAVREVKGDYLGTLITVRGIITRVSDVKPAVRVNAYTCDSCGYEVFQEVTTKTFTPLSQCTSPQCSNNQSKGQLFMSTRASKFSAFQDVKIQELSNQVPVGHIPRTLSIHVNGDLVRSMNPGDIVDVSGIFLPSPYTGFRALKAGLLTETYLEAQSIRQHKNKYDKNVLTSEVETKIREIQQDGNVYSRLASSIAPEIFGLLDVKKTLLLLLVGGVTKELGDGMKIRGDINVCLMGDPGVAKSQLLKSITHIAPRGVYTTGKGSSGVGLTAAVMRDPITDEMILEGGALVLADNGICSIDEFDKMDENDRTAIHEVMEQQTISISKAGITTTLNARTSILAAANPLHGRYNTRISPHENINLPAALLSRFDVIFLLLDKPSRDADERLAEHVAYVHMHNKHPEMEFEPLDATTMREYISMAKQCRPIISQQVSDYVVQSYTKMRKESKDTDGSKKQFSHATPRTLLAILRLAQALARIRFDSLVTLEDVDEALRLIQVSKQSLYDDDTEVEDFSPTTRIYHFIRSEFLSNEKEPLDIIDLKTQLLNRSFTELQINHCIDKYEDLNIWWKINGEKLTLTNRD